MSEADAIGNVPSDKMLRIVIQGTPTVLRPREPYTQEHLDAADFEPYDEDAAVLYEQGF